MEPTQVGETGKLYYTGAADNCSFSGCFLFEGKSKVLFGKISLKISLYPWNLIPFVLGGVNTSKKCEGISASIFVNPAIALKFGK